MKKSTAAFHIATSPHRHILIAISLFLCASPALASPSNDLAQTQQEMEASRTRQAELTAQNQKLQDELRALKEKLVQSAARLQENEAGLAAAEGRLHILDNRLQAKGTALKADRKKLASLLQSALRLSRTPPEAMVMMPGDAMETMEAARALKMVSEAIRQESESIAAQIGELQALKQQVTAEHDELARRQADLAGEHDALNHQLKARAALQAKVGQEQKDEAKKLARLARKAEDLQELVASLQESRQHPWPDSGRRGEAEDETRSSRSLALGHARRPAAGLIVQRFGDGHNRTSKGMVIATPSDAQVVAPYQGKVVYAGKFLNYGRMVIIRHDSGFYTLLAGLAKINVEPGEFLLEGEPIGAMGESKVNDRLYIELRKDNQPVNPAAWIEMK